MGRGAHAKPRSRAPWVMVLGAVVLVGLGITSRVLPQQTVATTTTTTTTTTTLPPVTMPTAACPRSACVWTPVDTWDHRTPVYITSVHPVATPTVTANVGWFRTSEIDLGLYPGYEGPGATALPRGPEEVPLAGRPSLLATFNSGFYESDAAAGFYTNHTSYFPMVTGAATLVRYTNGRLAIEAWPGGPIPASVVMARQNLQLLVNHGRPTPTATNNALWGLTLHGVAAVWRSAIGLDANGNLLYVAAPYQTSATLAALMVQLHVVSAMQLDINPEWPILVTYGGPGAAHPSLDVANPNQIPGRFLYTSTKDFFAVYVSHRPGEPTPW